VSVSPHDLVPPLSPPVSLDSEGWFPVTGEPSGPVGSGVLTLVWLKEYSGFVKVLVCLVVAAPVVEVSWYVPVTEEVGGGVKVSGIVIGATDVLSVVGGVVEVE